MSSHSRGNGEGERERGVEQIPVRYILGISGGISFFTYLPTTPSLIVLRSLFFFDSILHVGLIGNEIKTSNRKASGVTTLRRPNLSDALRVTAFETEKVRIC